MTGDFLKAWLKCEAALAKMDSEFAPLLLASLKNSEVQLMDNISFLSAIYMDPRFRTILSEQEVARARIHLMITWTKLEKINLSASSQDIVVNVVADEESDELEVFIKEREQEVASTSEAATTTSGQLLSRSNLQLAIDKYECELRVNSRLSVLQYWRSKRFVYPELFRLSEIVLPK
jgi:hypothetical protein